MKLYFPIDWRFILKFGLCFTLNTQFARKGMLLTVETLQTLDFCGKMDILRYDA